MTGRITAIKRSRIDPTTNRPKGGGYGFIEAGDGVSRFFHVNGVEGGPDVFDALKEGQAVEFEPYEESGRGDGKSARARAVRPA